MRWVEVGEEEPGREVFCAATALRLKHYRDIFPFIKLNYRIAARLNETPGLIRYALAARFFTRRFRTLTVWRDRESMMPFLGGEEHLEAVDRFDAWVERGAFAEWSSDDGRPSWDEAARRLEEPTAVRHGGGG